MAGLKRCIWVTQTNEAQELQEPHCDVLSMVLLELITDMKKISLTQTKRDSNVAEAECKDYSKKAYPQQLNFLNVYQNATYL